MPNKVGRWLRWLAASFAAALTPRAGRKPPSAAAGPVSPKSSRPRWRIGRVSQNQPPPLPPSSVPPALPADGPAAPRRPVSARRAAPDLGKTKEPDRDDPFERLRRTALDSPEDRALEHSPQQTQPVSRAKAADRQPERSKDDGTQLCLPAARLPAAILWILDDGQRTGQSVRMRSFPFLIGRTEGHARIPHDAAIEPLHVEISWCGADSEPQILIRDLSSEEGLFVRAVKSRVKVGQEIRMGSGRYRLTEHRVLEELSPQTDLRLPLEQPDIWLGRTPECAPLDLGGDPMVDPRHARMTRDADDVWRIEDHDSLNGTWVRVPQIRTRSRAEILIGEQVLVVDIPRLACSAD